MRIAIVTEIEITIAAAVSTFMIMACHDTSLVGDSSNTDVFADHLDADMEEGSALPIEPFDEVPQCGNGVVEEGEECDDRNRLDGDECDWSCHLGNGEDPLPPDPAVSHYTPSGPSVTVDGVDIHGSCVFDSHFPVIWTGTSFAVAVVEGTGYDADIRFFRMSESGERLFPEWTLTEPLVGLGWDLAWTGSIFGLFYSDIEAGIYMMILDSTGKPLGSPTLIEEDVGCRSVSVAAIESGFTLAWIKEGNWSGELTHCDRSSIPDELRMKVVSISGEVISETTVIDHSADSPVDLATDESGFGIVYDDVVDGPISCMTRFLKVDGSTWTISPSGILGIGYDATVRWVGDHYSTAWIRRESEVYNGICVARFGTDGSLEMAPVCNDTTDSGIFSVYTLRMAAGNDGLAVTLSSGDAAVEAMTGLFFLRLDAAGTAVDDPVAVPPEGLSYCYSSNMDWSTNGIGIFRQSDYGTMLFQFFTEE